MIEVFYVAAGGFFGAICRFILSRSLQKKRIFPIGTLVVNLIGAFLLGLVAGMHVKGHGYSLLGIGFLGAFTTFSTFKLESEQLRKKKKNSYFYTYLAISYTFGVGLAYVGIVIGKSII